MQTSPLSFSALFDRAVLPSIQQAFSALFQAADQAILQLALKSPINKEQNRYFEAAQNLRIIRFEIMEQFFLQLRSGSEREGHAQFSPDLQHQQSLRELLSIKPEQYQADPNLAAGFADCEARVQHISNVDERFINPLQPVQFVQAFLQTVAALDLDVHSKMLVLRLFEVHLYGNLVSFLAKLNDAMAEEGILPSLSTAASEGDLNYSVNAVVDKVERALADAPVSGGDKLELAQGACYSALEELQADDVERLWQVLDAENKVDAWQDFLMPQDLMQSLINNGLKVEVLSSQERLVLDRLPLLEQLFDQFVENPALSTLAKAMLRALQLPYARLVVLDSSFFQNDNHPARLLLREINLLCETWEPKSANLSQDNFYLLLQDIVQQFVEAERIHLLDYHAMQVNLLTYREAKRQKQLAQSQRLHDDAYTAQLTERARQDALSLINEKLKGRKLPFSASKFIQEAWGHVLYVHAIKSGLDSATWLEAVANLDALLDSFAPDKPYQNRSELLVKLPSILRSIREQLVNIEMDKQQINSWFAELEQAHKALAVSIGGELSANPLVLLEQASADLDSTTPTEQVMAEPAKHKQAIETKALSETAKQLLDNITQGVWFNWNRPEGQLRCQLAAILKHIDTYVLIDRSGKKVANLLERELIIKLQSHEIEVVHSGAKFDKTLASVIGDIRGDK